MYGIQPPSRGTSRHNIVFETSLVGPQVDVSTPKYSGIIPWMVVVLHHQPFNHINEPNDRTCSFHTDKLYQQLVTDDNKNNYDNEDHVMTQSDAMAQLDQLMVIFIVLPRSSVPKLNTFD
ncbi:hypothetical protein J6590_052831 [Homalodisca vitripennis]|nr:hypothetical protein J6590_052831 [Homalodisca vitripennis]